MLTVTGKGTVSAVKTGSVDVNATNYTIVGDKITLKKEYLSTLEDGEKTFKITKGSVTVAVKVTIETTA